MLFLILVVLAIMLKNKQYKVERCFIVESNIYIIATFNSI